MSRVDEFFILARRPGVAGDTSQSPQASASPRLPARERRHWQSPWHVRRSQPFGQSGHDRVVESPVRHTPVANQPKIMSSAIASQNSKALSIDFFRDSLDTFASGCWSRSIRSTFAHSIGTALSSIHGGNELSRGESCCVEEILKLSCRARLDGGGIRFEYMPWVGA